MISLHIPQEVHCGSGALDMLPQLIRGRKALLLADAVIIRFGYLNKVMDALKAQGAELRLIDALPPEPTIEQAQDVVAQAQAFAPDTIVGVGGGSVMDVAKLCAVLVGGTRTVRELRADPSIARHGAHVIMVPTTAGTGAEATPNAIVAIPEEAVKVGIVSHAMIPDTVLLDGDLLKTLPAGLTATTGVDALCHVLECYTSRKATPFSDLYAEKGIRLIFRHLKNALSPENTEDKNGMLLAAFYGGVAITCSGTTAVHGLSYPLGGRYHIPHGAANAMLLLPVMRFNAEACEDEFAALYDLLEPGNDMTHEEKAAGFLDALEALLADLPLPRDLSQWGVKAEDLPDIARSGLDVRRLMDNNKRAFTLDDAIAVYSGLLPKGM